MIGIDIISALGMIDSSAGGTSWYTTIALGGGIETSADVPRTNIWMRTGVFKGITVEQVLHTFDFRFRHGIHALETHLLLEAFDSEGESERVDESICSSLGSNGRTMIIQPGFD